MTAGASSLAGALKHGDPLEFGISVNSGIFRQYSDEKWSLFDVL